MSIKQFPLRLDEATTEQLRFRSIVEKRSMNEIVGEAIREYARAHPVPREELLALVRTIAKEDASLLRAQGNDFLVEDCTLSDSDSELAVQQTGAKKITVRRKALLRKLAE